MCKVPETTSSFAFDDSQVTETLFSKIEARMYASENRREKVLQDRVYVKFRDMEESVLQEFKKNRDSRSEYLASYQDDLGLLSRIFNNEKRQIYETLNTVFEEHDLEEISKPFDEFDVDGRFQNTYEFDLGDDESLDLIEYLSEQEDIVEYVERVPVVTPLQIVPNDWSLSEQPHYGLQEDNP